MPTDHRAKLATIKRFDQLVTYLRDDMGWPIEGDDFEEITFDYTPEELGIDAANRAKIQQIKRLRPLTANQPWGIFFVRFEPKRLPVVALRRILSRVVLKKRAAANSADFPDPERPWTSSGWRTSGSARSAAICWRRSTANWRRPWRASTCPPCRYASARMPAW